MRINRIVSFNTMFRFHTKKKDISERMGSWRKKVTKLSKHRRTRRDDENWACKQYSVNEFIKFLQNLIGIDTFWLEYFWSVLSVSAAWWKIVNRRNKRKGRDSRYQVPSRGKKEERKNDNFWGWSFNPLCFDASYYLRFNMELITSRN